MNGTHIVANFHDCDYDFTQEAQLLDFCVKACTESGLSVVGQSAYQFKPQGITFAILLAESHLSMHTWPEHRSVAFDLYVCNHSKDNSETTLHILSLVEAHLQAKRVERQIIQRDDLFSKSSN